MALISTLVDNFATKDTTKWRDKAVPTNWSSLQRINSGKLEIDCTSGYSTLESSATYDLTNSALYCSIEQLPAQGGDNSTEMYFIMGDGTNNVYFIIGGSGGISWNYDGGFTGTQNFTTYNATTMKFLRIRHNGTNILLETGATATGAYTVRGTFTNSAAITALRASFQTGYYGTQSTPGVAQWDNFNFDPSAAAPNTGQFFAFF